MASLVLGISGEGGEPFTGLKEIAEYCNHGINLKNASSLLYIYS